MYTIYTIILYVKIIFPQQSATTDDEPNVFDNINFNLVIISWYIRVIVGYYGKKKKNTMIMFSKILKYLYFNK